MRTQEFLSFILLLLLLIVAFSAATSTSSSAAQQTTQTAQLNNSSSNAVNTTATTAAAKLPQTNLQTSRQARIMKILKEPVPPAFMKRNRNAPPPPSQTPPLPPNLPQFRRDRFPTNPYQQPQPQHRPMPNNYLHHHHRPPPPPPPPIPVFFGQRNQVLRRVQNGGPPHLPPQQNFNSYDNVKVNNNNRFAASGHKENIPPKHFGKTAVYRPQFPNSHPNALTAAAASSATPSQQQQHNSQQFLQNFRASPQFDGKAILRPASDYPQYKMPTNLEIQQYPLPQQQPQHRVQSQTQIQTQTAPQTFPPQPTIAKQYTEALLKSDNSAAATPQQQQTYSVYEDPETSEHATIQMNSQQNPLVYNTNTNNNNVQQPQQPQQMPVDREAEDYLRFMSTNEYFLPKFNPNYRKLDEDKDLRQYHKEQRRHQHQQQQQQSQHHYAKTLPPPIDKTGKVLSAYQREHYHPGSSSDPSSLPSSSTIVRGSYQAGRNVFVVNSDGNKAIKHIVPSSLAITQGTTPSSLASVVGFDGGSSYTNARFNSPSPSQHHHHQQQQKHTPEPIRFEFTERDAVLAGGGHTHVPTFDGNYHYQRIGPTPSGIIQHNRPISVNEVDADPEDGDDMQEVGTDFFGRVPFRSSTETSAADGSKQTASSSSTPATEQRDTEEYCESICANVQDENAEIVCGSDGYMYTGEAQMECYASCLNIDVTIQGKGSCSAR